MNDIPIELIGIIARCLAPRWIISLSCVQRKYNSPEFWEIMLQNKYPLYYVARDFTFCQVKREIAAQKIFILLKNKVRIVEILLNDICESPVLVDDFKYDNFLHTLQKIFGTKSEFKQFIFIAKGDIFAQPYECWRHSGFKNLTHIGIPFAGLNFYSEYYEKMIIPSVSFLHQWNVNYDNTLEDFVRGPAKDNDGFYYLSRGHMDKNIIQTIINHNIEHIQQSRKQLLNLWTNKILK